MINALGVMWGMTPPDLAQRMHALIAEHFDYTLPIKPRGEELVDMVRRDKKVAHGKMHFAVLRAEGDLVIEPRALDDELVAQVQAVLAGESAVGELVFGH